MVDMKFKFLSWTRLRAKMVQYAALVGQATLGPFRSQTLTVEAHHVGGERFIIFFHIV